MGKPSYTILVYQDTHLARVPKPALKRAFGEVLRRAKLRYGTYEFKVHAITTAKAADIRGNFKLEISKTERANRLKVTVQLSVKANDTYAGILTVPMQVITADLVEKLQTAALSLSTFVVPETAEPTEAPSPQEVASEPVAVMENLPPAVALPQDEVLERLSVLGCEFRALIPSFQGQLLLPRSALSKDAKKKVRRELAQIMDALAEIAQMIERRQAYLRKLPELTSS